ncbi:hypothetical protein PY254_17040 [Rhodanobacter sp. AS-Z3]|uniref:hypothetical protein n=1 Tax=Rhodanobacter sp. AS-Z3 TaxID=3031330 RepID=UPI00247AEAF5|nr:hypothetical protein [Rhodanobacter sp. AS-Z3]WEN14914.1 hypothetical protein PY254_17040 [Rhodanobacter sp. AS-Z3]
MNEFEWRLQMRRLRQPVAPPRDLWHAIDAALDQPKSRDVAAGDRHRRARRRWLAGAGVAASLLLALGVGWHVMRGPSPLTSSSIAANTGPWKPADPRFSGAAIELDAARMELLLALQQAPDSAALQRLLGRTEQQQKQLRQLASQPG